MLVLRRHRHPNETAVLFSVVETSPPSALVFILHCHHEFIASPVGPAADLRPVDGIRLQGRLAGDVRVGGYAFRRQLESVQHLHPDGYILGRPAQGGEHSRKRSRVSRARYRVGVVLEMAPIDVQQEGYT